MADYCGGMGSTLTILPQAAILPAVTQQWGRTGPSVSGFGDRDYGPTGGVHGQIAQDLALPLQFHLYLIQAWRDSHTLLEKVMLELRPTGNSGNKIEGHSG